MSTFNEKIAVANYNEEEIIMNEAIIGGVIEGENVEQVAKEDEISEEGVEESLEKEEDEAAEQTDVGKINIEGEQTDHEEDDFEDINLSDVERTKSKHSERSIGDAGVLTIVNSKKNGKRLSLAGEVIETLQCKEKVQIGLVGKGIAVFPLGKQDLEEFRLKKEGSKHIIYSGPLVQEITERYKLDYSNRTCITFPKVAYKEQDGIKFAYIKIA
ncbi:MAG: hypothetical protein ACLRY5_10990 [Zhenhengia sp.]